MQVSVEATNGLERRMTVAFPSERIEKEVENRLKSLAPRVKVPGFRPGKVPFMVVRQKFGGQVREEVVDQVITSSFYEAVAQEKLRPAGTPRIESQNQADSNFEFTATFEVYPEIHVAPVEEMTIERTTAEVTDQDVDNMLERLRKQRTSWKEADRKAQLDDRVIVEYHATVDGEAFAGNEGTDMPVVLGSKTMIAGFEDGLIGSEAGQEVEMDLTFPENYQAKELAGKAAHFKVKVTRVEEPELPELNEEFAAGFGVKEGGVEVLLSEVRANMSRELERALRDKVKQRVMDALLEKNAIDLPQSLVDQESERLAQQMEAQMQYQGIASKGQKVPRNLFESQARRRVALGLVLSEIVSKNELKASPDKVREAVEGIASTYEQPEEVVKWYMGDRGRMAEVESMVLEDQVVDWVLDHAQVTDIMASFDEIMSPQATQAA